MKSTLELVRIFLEKDDTLAVWFQLLCESGTGAIEAQAWQIAKTLRRDEEECCDAMLELAHKLLPDSPAGAEDPKQVLFREMGIWASRQPQDVQDRLAASLEAGFQEAWESGLGSFRKYLRARCVEASSGAGEAA